MRRQRKKSYVTFLFSTIVVVECVVWHWFWSNNFSSGHRIVVCFCALSCCYQDIRHVLRPMQCTGNVLLYFTLAGYKSQCPMLCHAPIPLSLSVSLSLSASSGIIELVDYVRQRRVVRAQPVAFLFEFRARQ